jgi:DNA (cytosine-5)-methyltransferase 1
VASDRPRLLDLFCGGGGAAMGYHRAGFDVTGVDIAPQYDYPFPFVLADALTFPLAGFDAVHASPPCKLFTAYQRKLATLAQLELFEPHADHLTPTLERFAALEVPWIVENVPGAPMPPDAVTYCGSSFGLDVRRHRLFASSVALTAPSCAHGWQTPRFPPAGNRTNLRRTVEVGAWRIPDAVSQAALGVDWLTGAALSQAIPPAYTEHIGGQILAVVST